MGVLGLWQLLEPVGHPIKIEGLEGKRLGVDANVWLYKFIRGFREKDNSANLDAHKLGLFNRISKLLYYKIKPVFVFDGPAPVLKRKTLERRQNVRNKHIAKVQDTALRLLAEQLKGQYPNANIDQVTIALPELRSNNLVAAEKFTDEDRELFYLPPQTIDESELAKDSDSDEVPKPSNSNVKIEQHPVYHVDTDDEELEEVKFSVSTAAQDIDIESEEFAKLPAEVRYEILVDIKEARRRIRRYHDLPEDANSFSNLQMERLRQRRLVQEKIEQCEKDICSMYTGECNGQSIQSYRMQSDATSTMIYLSNSKDPKSHIDKNSESLDPNIRGIYNGEINNTRLSAKQSKEQNPNANKDQVTIALPELQSNNLVAAEKSTDEDREIFYLQPRTIDESELAKDSDSDEEPKPSNSNVKIEQHPIYHVDTDDEELEEVKFSDPTAAQDIDIESEEFAKLPAEVRYEIHALPEDTSTMIDLSNSKDRTSHIDKNSESLDPNIRGIYNGEINNTRLSAKQSKEQNPNANKDQVTIALPELQSNNLVAAEKFTDEDRELFYLPPQTIDESELAKDSDSDEEPKPSNSNVKIEQHPVYHVDTDDEELEEVKFSDPTACQDIDIEPEEFAKLPAEVRYEIHALPEDTSTMIDLSNSKDRTSHIDSNSESLDRNIEGVYNGENDAGKRLPLFDKNPEVSNRMTNKVTNKIVEEAKELLRLFGIPYIDAAGEAEAQCALLEKLKLTEGTITDDSDVWLFGAQNVYRYFFSDDKYVMQYKMTDIEFHIRMDREALVCFAMLVGSDYTDGILNVGPVNALEILSEFSGQGLEPLIKFRQWKEKYQATKGRIPGSKKRERLLKFILPEEFPSRAVFEGYLRPMADSSTEEFIWGLPELDELREYTRRHFGWDPKRADDKLLPVMKRLTERRTQPTIDKFFFKTAANQNPELFRSKRVNDALHKISKKSSEETDDVVNLSESGSDVDIGQASPVKKTKITGGRSKRQTKTAPQVAKPKKGKRSEEANQIETNKKMRSTASTSSDKRRRIKAK